MRPPPPPLHLQYTPTLLPHLQHIFALLCPPHLQHIPTLPPPPPPAAHPHTPPPAAAAAGGTRAPRTRAVLVRAGPAARASTPSRAPDLRASGSRPGSRPGTSMGHGIYIKGPATGIETSNTVMAYAHTCLNRLAQRCHFYGARDVSCQRLASNLQLKCTGQPQLLS